MVLERQQQLLDWAQLVVGLVVGLPGLLAQQTRFLTRDHERAVLRAFEA